MRILTWFALGSALCYGLACGGGSGGSDAGLFSGAGGAAAGGAGGNNAVDMHPQTPTTFCVAENRVFCKLAFQCIPAASRDATFTATFGASEADCEATVAPAQCTTASADCPGYDASLGGACVTALAAFSCADLAGAAEPTSCIDACSSFGGTGGTTGTTGAGGGAGNGGAAGSGGRAGSGGVAGGSGGASGQLPLCPSDYETASCPTVNQSCRIDCASGLCGCTCSALGGSNRWSCVIF